MGGFTARGVNEFTVSQLATTADLVEAILRTPEPGRTRLWQAWRRLREYDRAINASHEVTIVANGHLKEDAEAELYRRLWIDEGYRAQGCSALARALGVTRNTAVAKLGRYGLRLAERTMVAA